MKQFSKARGVLDLIILLTCVAGVAGCQIDMAQAWEQQATQTAPSAQASQDEPELVIQNDSALPDTYPHANYELRFRTHGGVPVLHWKLEKGAR
jgi:hypothetical protein